MSLQFLYSIVLPEHIRPGGFDHAAVHRASGRLYVAHTVNDAIDVIDCTSDRYLYSIPGLAGVAGALVSDELGLVFTSNRAENTVGIFAVEEEQSLVKIPVGIRPNGLSFDPRSGLLVAANVGDPELPDSFTLSVVDIQSRRMVHTIPVPGRTRWTVFDPQTQAFYVNIADPAQIVVVEAAKPDQVARSLPIPAAGPHGLDLDMESRRLFCACDSGILLEFDPLTGMLLGETDLSGVPDVIFFNPALRHLYVAVGDAGVIDVIDTTNLDLIESIPTGKGAHTLAFNAQNNQIYAFLPQTHSASVYEDR